MSAAVAAASPKVKKVTKPKTPAEHPPYAKMVKEAIAKLADRKGSSRAAIAKYITANFKVGTNVATINAHLRSALKRGSAAGTFTHVKGTGASGSFRLGEKKSVEKKAVKKTVKKPVAKKASAASPKKVIAKKPKAAKKTSATKSAKSPKKAAKAKSPKKAAAVKKPVAKKAAKSPKKAAATKKPKAAKPAAKKAAPAPKA